MMGLGPVALNGALGDHEPSGDLGGSRLWCLFDRLGYSLCGSWAPPLGARLRYSADLGDQRLIGEVDEALRQAEGLAIDGATPTPYGRELIVAAYNAGRALVIASNNSEAAIRTYLAKHRLSTYLGLVIGRAHSSPG